MAVTLTEVRRILSSDEPDYAAAARLGPSVLPHLLALAGGADARMAAKAASLAGMIPHPSAVDVLRRAAASGSAVVRVAAAGAARRLRLPAAGQIVLALLNDADAGVRKFAIKAAAGRPEPQLL